MLISNKSRKSFCILLCISIDLIVTNGAKLPTIDIQGSLQKDSSTSRQPKFLFGVSKYLYSMGFTLITMQIRPFPVFNIITFIIVNSLQQSTTTSTTTLSTSTLCYSLDNAAATCDRKKRSIFDEPIHGRILNEINVLCILLI